MLTKLMNFGKNYKNAKIKLMDTKEKLKIIILAISITVIAFIAGSFSLVNKFYTKSHAKNCNVALIPLKGLLGSSMGEQAQYDGEAISSSSEEIVRKLLLAEENPRIKAIMVSIDSSGGSVFAGEEIANALKSLTKLNVAIIRGAGASSAYLAATGADVIFASPMSGVGDMGVTASYLDQTAKDAKDGYKYVEITSTEFKDAGSPHRPLSKEEREGWIASVKEDHEIFVSEVAENRNLAVEDVATMADGTSVNGIDAVDYGLTDGIGDIVSTIDYISNEIGRKAVICWN